MNAISHQAYYGVQLSMYHLMECLICHAAEDSMKALLRIHQRVHATLRLQQIDAELARMYDTGMSVPSAGDDMEDTVLMNDDDDDDELPPVRTPTERRMAALVEERDVLMALEPVRSLAETQAAAQSYAAMVHALRQQRGLVVVPMQDADSTYLLGTDLGSVSAQLPTMLRPNNQSMPWLDRPLFLEMCPRGVFLVPLEKNRMNQ